MASTADQSAKLLFQAIVDRCGGARSGGRGFGSDALKIDGKIFASLSKGRLLLKLPAERVDALVESGVGERFSTGAGREKKEWITIGAAHGDIWPDLADEARDFVGGRS